MIMNRTQEQDTEALASFMAWPPVPKAEQLQKGVIDMDDEMERLVDGGFDINAQLESHVLGKLTKTIRAQDRHKFDVSSISCYFIFQSLDASLGLKDLSCILYARYHCYVYCDAAL